MPTFIPLPFLLPGPVRRSVVASGFEELGFLWPIDKYMYSRTPGVWYAGYCA